MLPHASGPHANVCMPASYTAQHAAPLPQARAADARVRASSHGGQGPMGLHRYRVPHLPRKAMALMPRSQGRAHCPQPPALAEDSAAKHTRHVQAGRVAVGNVVTSFAQCWLEAGCHGQAWLSGGSRVCLLPSWCTPSWYMCASC